MRQRWSSGKTRSHELNSSSSTLRSSETRCMPRDMRQRPPRLLCAAQQLVFLRAPAAAAAPRPHCPAHRPRGRPRSLPAGQLAQQMQAAPRAAAGVRGIGSAALTKLLRKPTAASTQRAAAAPSCPRAPRYAEVAARQPPTACVASVNIALLAWDLHGWPGEGDGLLCKSRLPTAILTLPSMRSAIAATPASRSGGGHQHERGMQAHGARKGCLPRAPCGSPPPPAATRGAI